MACADLILTGARIYTGDARHPTATALAVSVGAIVAFDADVDSWRDEGTVVRDAAGAFVMPGFVDVHNHHALAGRIDLFGGRESTLGAVAGAFGGPVGTAVAVAADRAAPLDEDAQRACSARGIEILSAFGVTAFQDGAASLPIMRALAQLDDAGELHAWVVSSMPVNDPLFGFSPVGAELLLHGETHRREHHRPDFVKVFLDDVHGDSVMSADELYDWLRTATERGLSATAHCTSSSSAGMLLDAVARLRTEGFAGARFQVSHAQFLADEQLPRLVDLGVSADITPFWRRAEADPEALTGTAPELAPPAPPNRELLDLGATVAGGTDWPVSESPNPWVGIQRLVTGVDPQGRTSGTGFFEQSITLAEAIAVFTRHAATAMGLGAVTGSLEPDKSADFIVLDRDPFQSPVETLIDIRVLETWFAGRLVHAEQTPPAPALTKEMQ